MIMMEIRRLMVAHAVCVLVAMYLLGCAATRMTSLCEAIVAGNVDRAIQIVKQGADVNAGSGCALFAAASRGQMQLVKLLLEHEADPNRSVSGDLAVIMGASTPLEAAAISRKVEMVQILLENGANPRNDFKVFFVVLNFGDVEMAELLLRYGADPNMASPSEEDVYAYEQLTTTHSQQVIVPPRDLEPDRIDDTAKRFQCDMSGPESLLYTAIYPGSAETQGGLDSIVEMLLARGADPNVRTINGASPLMFAASQQNHRVITMLMQAGADVSAADRCGRTAEDYADLYPHHQRANLAPQTKALLQEHQRN